MISKSKHPGIVVLAFLAVFSLLLPACDTLDIKPDTFEYPLDLEVTQNESILTLSWSPATVSTFEEYIILRSTDPIRDSAEPEVMGNTFILARIDERNVTTFQDVNTPITDTLYYKVYAKIADRFLMTATVAHDQNLHLIPVRSDAVAFVPETGHLVGIDRSLSTIYVYDLNAREMIENKPANQFSSPMIRPDYSTGEILVGDNSSLYIFDYHTLTVKNTSFPGTFRDMHFRNGYIYLQRAQFPYAFALYRRSDMSLRDEISVIQNDWRKSFVRIENENPVQATIYDFAVTGSARYVQNGNDLSLDLSSQSAINGSFTVFAAHPTQDEFIVSNTGTIIDENLQQTGILNNGAIGFNFFTYSPDGKTLYGITFQASSILRSYDVDNDYAFIEERMLSNQVSPLHLFADSQNVHIVSQAFVDGTQKTLITSIAHQ